MESPVSSPTWAGAVAADQVGVLLVGQRLDRGGVEALAALGEGQEDRELADDGLAGAGRRGDQHPGPALHVRAGLALVVVEDEAVAVGERRQRRRALPGAESGVRLGGGRLVGSRLVDGHRAGHEDRDRARHARRRSAGRRRSARRPRSPTSPDPFDGHLAHPQLLDARIAGELPREHLRQQPQQLQPTDRMDDRHVELAVERDRPADRSASRRRTSRCCRPPPASPPARAPRRRAPAGSAAARTPAARPRWPGCTGTSRGARPSRWPGG